MNVLVLSDLWQPFPGGAERLLFNIARDLDRRDEFTVRVLTGYENAKRFDGPPVTTAPIGIGDQHNEGWTIIDRHIQGIDLPVAVIVAHHLYAYEFETELCATGIPVVQVVHNTRRIDCAALAVFNSDYSADQIGVCPRDLVMIPPAYPDVVARTDVPPHARDGIGFMKPIEHKGVDLVYAIARAMPDRQFAILRGEWQTLETIVDLPNVRFLDPVDDIATFYAQCRIVLMPSVSEDAGTVAQECALNRIPCVSTNVGGLRQTNAGGVRLDSRHVDVWVHTIRELDHVGWYQQVAERQQRALDATCRDDRMGKLADRICRLGSVG